jgi:hypothetical protein
MPVITQSDLKQRNSICNACGHWQRGVCNLGHALQSTYGCPLKKFPPIGAASYLKLDMERYHRSKPLTWPRVLEIFAESMVRWVRAKIPLVSGVKHGARFSKCRVCPLYRNFQCTACSCLAYIKAKLATEICPENLWPR